MTHLPIRLAPAMLALVLASFGFRSTDRKAEIISTTSAHNQAKFYWYEYTSDLYFNYNSIPDECYELWIYYGVLVNTSPGGGMLVARGYANNAYPHNLLPTQFLYAH